MKRKAFIIATIAVLLILGVVIWTSYSTETFGSLEPKAVIVILVNCLLYVGIGILIYRLLKKKSITK